MIYLQNERLYSNLIIKICLSIIMVYIAYLPKSFKKLFKELIMFYLISFVFGGSAFALLYFVKPENIMMRNGVYVGNYPLKIALLGGITGFVISHIAFKLVKNKFSTKNMYCEINIQINNKTTYVKALIDSGNLLKDPISGYPVIVVEKYKLEGILPLNILENLKGILQGNYSNEDLNDELQYYLPKFRVIPFSSLGKQNGMLLGIKADKVIISFEEEEIIIHNSIIGIYDDHLNKNEKYTALVGLDLLERRTDSEFTSNIKV